MDYMLHSGGETEAAGESSLSGAHGEGSQGQGSRSSAVAAGSAPAGAATGSTDKGEILGSAKEKPQDTLKRLSNLKKKGQGDFWQWLEPVLVAEAVNEEEVQVCKQNCVRGAFEQPVLPHVSSSKPVAFSKRDQLCTRAELDIVW